MTSLNSNSPPADPALPVYPLLLKPEFRPRVWGGRRLAAVLGASLPEGAIGESWSMGTDSPVENGPLAGQVLGALAATEPSTVLGRAVLATGRRDLPLLFKVLDANDLLSIQVHPDDRYAREVEGSGYGKTEAWYVLDAAPGAYVIHGFTRPLPAEAVRAGLADGSIVAALRKIELHTGDAFLVPAGTVHAIGGGLLLGEIQENSDITYRLYDWGRPRETHVAQGLAVMDRAPAGFGPSAPLDIHAGRSTVRFLIACRYFVFQALTVNGRLARDTAGRSFACLFCYAGAGRLRYGDATLEIAHGQTVFVPAALGAYTLEGEECRFLCSFVPDLRQDVVAPLEKAGYSAAQIAALAGPPGNELERLLDPAPGG